MHRLRSRALVLTTSVAGALATVCASGGAALADPEQPSHPHPRAAAQHVLLLSVDGLHQSDLTRYVSAHPHSALAALVGRGTEYEHATTTFPSDSFPGMVAQLTGAGPGRSGIYYDDTYDRTLFPAGTTSCTGTAPGAEVAWTEAADRSQNPIALDAGQGLTDPALERLPTNTLAQTLADAPAITTAALRMTSDPTTLLDPAALPVDPATCTPIYPHTYLKTNTVFDVVKAAGGRTAWSDKHAAYEILNGPSGNGVDDLFTPEINSVADKAGDDWTTDNALTQEYDAIKVAAVVNEIKGYDHSGTHRVGTPAVFGMNFQTLSTAQKLPSSDGLAGGYTASGAPGPLVSRALDSVDAQIGRLQKTIDDAGLAGSTTVILSAKHGQSPVDPSALRRVDDAAIIDSLNAAWKAENPRAGALVAFSTDDDAMLLWLTDRSAGAEAFAKEHLLTHSAPAGTVTDAKGVHSAAVAASGLSAIYTGEGADRFVGSRSGDARTPDLIGLVQHGVVYTGGVKKIAEHGGDDADDRDVALVVAGPGARHQVVSAPVQTAQIAPSILALLGLDPSALQAVRAGTAELPVLRTHVR